MCGGAVPLAASTATLSHNSDINHSPEPRQSSPSLHQHFFPLDFQPNWSCNRAHSPLRRIFSAAIGGISSCHSHSSNLAAINWPMQTTLPSPHSTREISGSTPLDSKHLTRASRTCPSQQSLTKHLFLIAASICTQSAGIFTSLRLRHRPNDFDSPDDQRTAIRSTSAANLYLQTSIHSQVLLHTFSTTAIWG